MKRSYFSRPLLLAAVSSISLFGISSAHAAGSPELQFHPSKSWNLASQDMQCSVSNRFNNGFILRFNGTPDWVENLQIDFKQEIFEADKVYKASLSVPGVAQAQTQAVGANGSTLEISLDEHVDLYKALRKNGVLDVDVEKNRFRFYLTGFSGVAQNFERCMASLSEEPIDPQAPVELKTSRFQGQSSEDGPERFMENEAQAMEQQEKEKIVAVTEILPENPQPVVQEIPYREVTKVKDVVVEENQVVPPQETPVPIEAEQPIASASEVEDTAIPAERLIAAANAKAPEPVPVLKVEDPQIHQTEQRRMSEILAEQIINNPDIIAQGGGAFPLERKMVKPAAPAPMAAKEESAVMDEAAKEDSMKEMAAVKPSHEPLALVESPETEASMTEAAPMPQEPLEPVEVTEVTAVPEPSPISAVPEKPVEKEMAKEPAQAITPMAVEAQAPKPVIVQNAKTPEIKTHKEIIRAQADFTQLEPAAANDYGYADPEMSKRISELEKQVKVLKAENMSLNADLRESLQASEEERMSIASENWNLERATMRFNEAERQIQRLGQQLQRERAKCTAEKQDLEAMLFDPQVTNDQQLARLADLETQLMEAKAASQEARLRYEQRIGILEERLNASAQ